MIVQTTTSLLLLLEAVAAIQPQARDSYPDQQLRDLEWGDLNILHTTDNHGWHGGHLQEPQYSADLGDYISFVSHMRRRADDMGVDLLVVDSGDRAEGNGLWDASDPKGRYTRKIIQQLDLDLLTTGNHELYNGNTSLNEHLEMVPHFQGRYLSSNIDINITGEWEPMADRTTKFTTKNLGINITAFGFLFDFTGNAWNTRVTPVHKAIQQQWFQDTIADKDVDLFLVIAHIDTEFPELRQIFDAIRAVHPETPIQFMAGHEHTRKFKVFDSKSTAIESGRYCETAGWVSLDGLLPEGDRPLPRDGGPLTISRRYIDFNRVGFQHHSNTTTNNFDTPEGLKMTADITHYRHLLGLNRLIGCAPQDWTLFKDPYPGPNNWYSYITDHILPEMVRNASRADIPHIIFINGGSQRFDIFKGPFTYDTSFLVSPFTSRFHYAPDIPIEVANQLLDFFLHDPRSYVAEGELSEEESNPHINELPSSNAVQKNQAPLARKYTEVPGYTTTDEYGSTGDDTVHINVPTYPPPKVVQSNVSIPADPAPGLKIDVVFFDFIAGKVADGLNTIVGEEGRYKKEDFPMYMTQEDTSTKLLLEYVESRWGKSC